MQACNGRAEVGEVTFPDSYSGARMVRRRPRHPATLFAGTANRLRFYNFPITTSRMNQLSL